MLGLKVSNSCEEGKDNFDKENFGTAFLYICIQQQKQKQMCGSGGWIKVHTLLLVSDANIPRCGFQSNSTTISSTRKITVSSKRNLSPIQSAQNQQR